MGFFDIFRKKEKSQTRSSSTRSSSMPQRSAAPEMTIKQKIATGAWKVVKTAGTQVKRTAGNVKANVVYAAEHKEKVFPIEKKGFKKLGGYKPGSRDLKWTMDRYKRDGYSLATAKAKNGYGENVIVLFAKYGKSKSKVNTVKVIHQKAKKKAKTAKPARIPPTLTVDGKRYQKGGTFGDDKAAATHFAKRLKADNGFMTRVKKISFYGEPVYTVYYRSGTRKAKNYY